MGTFRGTSSFSPLAPYPSNTHQDFAAVCQQEDRIKAESARASKLRSHQQSQLASTLASSASYDDPSTSLPPQPNPDRYIAQTQDHVQSQLIAERDVEIRAINSDMSKVNEIFKDLASIVDSQQGEIDNIERLMEESHVHAKAGLEQVQQANEYQKGCVLS